MVAYHYDFRIALVKGSPNVVAANATVLVYDPLDTTYTTPITVYSNPGLTTIVNLVADQYGIVPDFWTDNKPDLLWKSGTLTGGWATTSSRPGLRGPSGAPGNEGPMGPNGAPGLNGANGEVSRWQTGIPYAVDDPLLNPDGELVKVITAHTSGGSYDATKFSTPYDAAVAALVSTSSTARTALDTRITAQTAAPIAAAVAPKLDIDKSKIVRKVERAVLTKFPRPRAVALGVTGTTIDLYQQVTTSKWWKTCLRSRTFANGGPVHQIEDQHIVQAFALVGSADAGIVYAGGTWFGNPGDVRNARSAGCTATWTSPATATDVLLVTSTSTNGGLAKVSIDGSLTAANQLMTAQQVVDNGWYPNTILVANGGTLNPTDRVVDFNSASLVASTNFLLATGLTAAAHTVVITSTAYYRVGKTATDIRVNVYGFGSASGQKLATAGTTATQVEAISTVASAWEYALKTRINVGGVSEFLGNVHGYENETATVIKVDGVTTTVADGSIVFPRDEVSYTRTTWISHPESAGAKVADIVTTYTLTRDGLTVDVTVTWTVAGWLDTAYLMMPLAGKNAGVQAFDRIDLLENAVGPILLTGAEGTVYKGRSKSAAAWAWQSQGKHAIAIWADDVLGYTNGWTSSGVIEASFEDRGGILTKLYLAKVATPAAGIPFAAGAVHTSKAHYVMARFDSPEAVLG